MDIRLPVHSSSPKASARFESVGHCVLWALFAGAVAGVLWTSATAPEWLWVFPVAACVAVVMLHIVPSAAATYLAAVLGFALIASFDEGIQISEVAYTAAFLSYLGIWFAYRWASGERLLWNTADVGIAIFVGWSLLSVLWAPLVGAQVSSSLSEATLVSLLLFYFPTREIVIRHPRGPAVVLAAIAGLGLYATVRNLLDYRRILLSAIFEWQTSIGRITTNEMLLIAGALVFMGLAVSLSSLWRRSAATGALVLTLGALVITQSRAFWVDFLLGSMVMIVVLRGRSRQRLLGLMVIGSALVVLVGVVLFPGAIEGISSGLLARFGTIGTAVSNDISLRSRFYEGAAVLEHIQRNPIVGHGLAARFSFYDIIADKTITRHFVHNGYLGLLFKGGLIGFTSMLTAWAALVLLAYRACQIHRRTHLELTSVIALAGLIAMLPSSSTSIHFYVGDTLLTMALLGGLAAGLNHRSLLPTCVPSKGPGLPLEDDIPGTPERPSNGAEVSGDDHAA